MHTTRLLLPINFSQLAQKVIREHYLKPFRANTAGKNPNEIERLLHGAQHVSRAAAYIPIIVHLLQKFGVKEALQISEEDLLLLQIVAIFHDSKRKGEGKDKWEGESAAACKKFLMEELHLSEEVATKFANLILLKENAGIFGKIFQSADALDVMRTRKEFNIEKLGIYEYSQDDPQKLSKLINLVLDVRQLIADQGDLTTDCTIKLYDQKIGHTLNSHFDIAIKKEYEHNNNCFERVTKDFYKYKTLGKYYDRHLITTSSEEEKSEEITDNPQFDETLKSSGFFIKAVKPNQAKFLFESIIPVENKHFPYRQGPKKLFTVDSQGVSKRSSRPAQYSKEEKNGYSQFQSTSYIEPDMQPMVFGYDKKNRTRLVGIIVPKEDALLSRRIFIYSGKTFDRSYDFATEADAKKYYDKMTNAKETKLFASPNDFKKTYAAELENDLGLLNEWLVHIRWQENNGKIGIFSDTLEARLLAQAYAKLAQEQLTKQYASNHEKLREDYKPSMVFYIPGTKRNYQIYSEAAQKKDIDLARELYTNSDTRKRKYKNKEYEFLLAQENSDEVLNEYVIDRKNIQIPLLVKLIADDFTYIADYLLSHAKHFELSKLLLSDSIDKKLIEKALINLTKTDNKILFNWLWQKCKLKIDPARLLMNAITNGSLEICNALLEDNRIKNSINQIYKDKHVKNYYLMFALEKGNFDIAASLIKNGASIDIKTLNGKSLLEWAISNGYPSVIEFLITQKANVNAADNHGLTPLMFASKIANMDAIVQLIKNGADINSKDNDGNTLLHHAIKNKQEDIVKLLLEKNADINETNKRGESPLHLAVTLNSPTIIQLLLQRKPDINSQNTEGKTPLHLAATSCFLTLIATQLIENGASLVIGDHEGNTPVHYAAMHSIALASEIISKNSELVNIKNKKGESLLLSIITNNLYMDQDLFTLIKLVIKSTNINETDNNNDTALHHAIKMNNVESAKLLIENGANLKCKNKDGKTPLELGLERKCSIKMKEFCEFTVATINKSRTPLQQAIALFSLGHETNNGHTHRLFMPHNDFQLIIDRLNTLNGTEINIETIQQEIQIASKELEKIIYDEDSLERLNAMNEFLIDNIFIENKLINRQEIPMRREM